MSLFAILARGDNPLHATLNLDGVLQSFWESNTTYLG